MAARSIYDPPMRYSGVLAMVVACGGSANTPDPDAAVNVDTAVDSAVDPTLQGTQIYLKAPHAGTGDQLGIAVHVSGDGQTLAVGAPFEDSAAAGVDGDQLDNSAPDSGAVYVYRRSGATWTMQAYLKASSPTAGDQFGRAVRLSDAGSTLVVGALNEAGCATGIDGTPDEACGGAGAAYVFVSNQGTWSQQAYVKASNTRNSLAFGSSLALSSDGNTLAVGQPGDASNATTIDGNDTDISARNAGAVFVFVRSGTTWALQSYIKASNAQAQDGFGTSVALSASGDVLAVGAAGEASSATGVGGSQLDNSAAESGAVYTFTRTGVAWTKDAYIKASNTGNGGEFGRTVALSAGGDTLAVGATGERSNATGIDGNQTDTSQLFAGAVYAFHHDTDWVQQAYIKEDVSNNADMFGFSIALSASGNLLAASAVSEQRQSPPMQIGGAYVFRRTGATWARDFHAFASNAEHQDLFGASLSLSSNGDLLAVGAASEDGDVDAPSSNAVVDSGAAYVIE